MSVAQSDMLESLPNGWRFDRLKDVVALRDVKTNEKSEAVDYVELEDIESGTGRLLNKRNTLEVESAVTLFRNGDVLFGKLRPYLEKYFEADFDGRCTGEILAFKPERIESGFLRYCVGSPWFIQMCDMLAYGSKMPRVNWPTQLATFDMPLPPVDEQKRIAAYLDASCRAIDAAVVAKRAQVEVLDALRATTIQHAVTRGTSKELVKSKIAYLDFMPKGWHHTRLKQIAAIRYGLGQPPTELDGGLPMIRATNVDHGVIRTEKLIYVDPNEIPEGKRSYLKENDIIVVRSGAYTGDSAIIPREWEGAVAGYDMVATVNRASPQFVAYALLSGYLLRDQIIPLTLRAAQPHLNAEELGSVLLILPSTIQEQEKIVAALEIELEKQNNVRNMLEQQITTLLAYRKSLIHECVTGQRRITDADVNRVTTHAASLA